MKTWFAASLLLPLSRAFLVSYYVGKQCHGENLFAEHINTTTPCRPLDGPKVNAASIVAHRDGSDSPNAVLAFYTTANCSGDAVAAHDGCMDRSHGPQTLQSVNVVVGNQ